MTPRARLRTRAVAAITFGVVALGGSAAPAAAHAGDAERATNYQTTIVSVPDLPGLSVSLADAGGAIEVGYDGSGEVVVYGYGVDPEPYLRIGVDGVFRNLQSDATYVNDSLDADTPIPAGVDPDNPPEWERVSTGSAYRWHDHRSHWMGVVDPPVVDQDPTGTHVVIEDWVIPITVDGQPADIRGDVTWVPGPAPWPWIALITIGAGVVAALGVVTRRGLEVGAALLAGVTCSSLVLGYRLSPVSPPWWWLAGVAGVLALLGAAALVLSRAWRRTGSVLAGLGGLGAALLVGFVDRAWLVRSLLPVDVHPAVGRGIVATSLALGAGLFIAASISLVGRGWSGPESALATAHPPSGPTTAPLGPRGAPRADPRLARSARDGPQPVVMRRAPPEARVPPTQLRGSEAGYQASAMR